MQLLKTTPFHLQWFWGIVSKTQVLTVLLPYYKAVLGLRAEDERPCLALNTGGLGQSSNLPLCLWFPKALISITVPVSHKSPVGRYYHDCHFTDKATEAQQKEMTKEKKTGSLLTRPKMYVSSEFYFSDFSQE